MTRDPIRPLRSFGEEAGVTLLELALAAGILATGFSMLFGSLLAIITVSQTTEDREIAAMNLETVMEEMRQLSFQELLSYAPPELGGPGEVEVVEVSCLTEDGGAVGLPISYEYFSQPLEQVFPNPLEVQVTLRWISQRGHRASLSTSSLFER